MPATGESVTAEAKNAICHWLEQGKTLAAYLREHTEFSRGQVYAATRTDADFGARFARARDDGHDAIAEETLEIIDTQPEMAQTEGGSHRDSAHVAWLKNRAYQRMQLLAKWNPKRYGERIEHTGEVKGTFTVKLDATDAAI